MQFFLSQADIRPDMTSSYLVLLALLPLALGASFIDDGKSSNGLSSPEQLRQQFDSINTPIDQEDSSDLNVEIVQDAENSDAFSSLDYLVQDEKSDELPSNQEDSNEALLEESLRLEDDVILESLTEAKREVEEEENAAQRRNVIKQRPRNYLPFHLGSKVQPNYAPTLKKAMILERTTNKLADRLG